MSEIKKKGVKADPWKEMVPVFIPMRSRTEQPTQLVSVNMRNFFVPKGVQIMVPKPVAEVLRGREEAIKMVYDEAKEDFGKSAAPDNGMVPPEKMI